MYEKWEAAEELFRKRMGVTNEWPRWRVEVARLVYLSPMFLAYSVILNVALLLGRR